MPISAFRRILGMKEEDLVDRLEPIDWRELEEKEKRRLYGF